MFTVNRCVLLLFVIALSTCQEYRGVCDNERNAWMPFCDSSLPINVRVQNIIASLTLDEKVDAIDHTKLWDAQSMDAEEYNWWNEALHGVAWAQGTHFRPPTEFSTVYPQVVSLAASFNKELFYLVGNATGNEARAFYNAGNAGLTFWSPNVNIYRDPRWGRGHETPGEDPVLNSEWARQFVPGMQGDHENGGFIKASACCKHFAAHSVEQDRSSFNSIVTEQDLADTYLPAFKTCVEEVNASCVMCAYNAINGVPSCANKNLLTNILRDQWGFEGYITSDCGAVEWIQTAHHYKETGPETCFEFFDAGGDLECSDQRYMTQHLRQAVDEGIVPEQMIDTALSRQFKVLMRLGYFEKDATRPYKELVHEMVDSQPHKQLALEAARQSIVLLKNAPNGRSGKPALPIDHNEFRARRASMALIGPHLDGERVFRGNYDGIPSSVKVPRDEILKYIPDLEWERGANVTGDDDSHIQAAVDLARASSQVLLFLGISAQDVEYEVGDRLNLTLTGVQPELVRRVLDVVQEPVIMFIVSGGAIDLSEYQNDPRVGAIIWAGYIGQAAGEAIADVLFGVYNPSGRLSQTFYSNVFSDEIEMTNMNLRPGNGSPGRTYRFYTGQSVVYPFGYGLSYTSFQYSFPSQLPASVGANLADECDLQVDLTVRNSGQSAGDHSVLWFLTPPSAGQFGRPIKSLINFEKLINVQPNVSRQIQLCLNRDNFLLANEQGEFQLVTGEWKLLVGSLEKTIQVL